MSNTLGLLLIGLGIGLIVGFVIFVQYMAKTHPETPLGRVCIKIESIIDRIPE